jgi:hypothetical protein
LWRGTINLHEPKGTIHQVRQLYAGIFRLAKTECINMQWSCSAECIPAVATAVAFMNTVNSFKDASANHIILYRCGTLYTPTTLKRHIPRMWDLWASTSARLLSTRMSRHSLSGAYASSSWKASSADFLQVAPDFSIIKLLWLLALVLLA